MKQPPDGKDLLRVWTVYVSIAFVLNLAFGLAAAWVFM